jgi:type II secretory pathway pseudopilin PulG
VAYCVHCGAAVAEGAGYCPACGKSLAAPPVAARRKSSAPVAMVVVIAAGGLLVVVAIIGIIAALLIPNFLDALQLAKQKRTVGDLRDIAVVLEERAAAQPAGAPPYPEVASIGELAAELEPHAGGPLATVDGWQRPFRYQCASAGAMGGCTAYRLGSGGRDGEFDHDDLFAYETGPFDPREYDGDIVVDTGTFVRWPERPRP